MRNNRDWNDNHNRQGSGDHLQKQKLKSRARLEDQIQPALPLATPATSMAAEPLTTPCQHSTKQTTMLPYAALPKLADRLAE